MHDHECGESCSHGPLQVILDLNEVLALIALFSLMCGRCSLETDIANAIDDAPPSKRRAARKAAIVKHQEEYWSLTESFKKAAKSAPVDLPAEFRGAMQEVLGGWTDDDVDVCDWVQESLGTLLWSIGAIDALPPITAYVDPQTTADAIARINNGACVPAFRAPEEVGRVWKLFSLARHRGDEALRSRALLSVDGPPAPSGPQSNDAPAPAGVLPRMREEALAMARAAGLPIEDGDVVFEGRPFGALSEADQRTAGFCAAARAFTMDWLIGEADSPL